MTAYRGWYADTNSDLRPPPPCEQMGAPCGSGGARGVCARKRSSSLPPNPASLVPHLYLPRPASLVQTTAAAAAATARPSRVNGSVLLAESARNTHPVVDMRPLLQLAFKRNMLPQNLHGRRRRLCRQSLGRRLLSCRLRRAGACSAHAARGCASHERGKASGMTEQRGSRKRRNTIRDKGTRGRRVMLKIPAGNARGASLCSEIAHFFAELFFQLSFRSFSTFVRAIVARFLHSCCKRPGSPPACAAIFFCGLYIAYLCLVF